MNLTQSKVSRIETGRVTPRPEDVREIVAMLEVPPAEASDLIAEAERVTDMARSLRRGQSGRSVERIQADLLESEAMHAEFRTLALSMVPGLLQTPDYARAVISLALPDIEPGALTAAVVKRLERQRVLHDPSVSLRFLLHPAVLETRYCGTAEHDVQLAHLTAVAGRENVDLRILDLGHRASAPIQHAFTVAGESTVSIELAHAEISVVDPEDVGVYRTLFDELARMGVPITARREAG